MESSPSGKPPADETVANQFIGPQYRPTAHGVNWISQGYAMFKLSPLAWILTVIVVLGGAILLSLIPVVGQFLGMLTTYIWIGGLILGCEAVSHGQKFDVRYLLAGFDTRYVGRLFTLSFLLALASNLIAYLIIGEDYLTVKFNTSSELPAHIDQIAFMKSTLIALVLTLPLMMASWFAPALIVLDGMSVSESLKLSLMGCIKNAMPFLVYGLILTGMYIAGVFTLGLAYLVVVPITYTSIYTSYRDIYWEKDAN